MITKNISRRRGSTCASLLLCAVLQCLAARAAAAPVGSFEGHEDVGTVLHPGSVEYDASKRTYLLVP